MLLRRQECGTSSRRQASREVLEHRPRCERDDCNFIRSHAFFSICSDKDFLPRLAKVGCGVTYDLPPHILFDNKASLVLPFWSLTREFFSDGIRSCFPLRPRCCGRNRASGRHARHHRRVFSISAISAVLLLEVCRVKLRAELGQQGRISAEQFGQRCVPRLLRQCLSGYERARSGAAKEEAQEDEIEYRTATALSTGSAAVRSSAGIMGPMAVSESW